MLLEIPKNRFRQWSEQWWLPVVSGERLQDHTEGITLSGAWVAVQLFKKPSIILLVAQSCLTFCNPMDSSPLGSSVHEISQARILESVAITFSRGFSSPSDRTLVSYILGRFFTMVMPHVSMCEFVCTNALPSTFSFPFWPFREHFSSEF